MAKMKSGIDEKPKEVFLFLEEQTLVDVARESGCRRSVIVK